MRVDALAWVRARRCGIEKGPTALGKASQAEARSNFTEVSIAPSERLYITPESFRSAYAKLMLERAGTSGTREAQTQKERKLRWQGAPQGHRAQGKLGAAIAPSRWSESGPGEGLPKKTASQSHRRCKLKSALSPAVRVPCRWAYEIG
jgi:hypothetical protein